MTDGAARQKKLLRLFGITMFLGGAAIHLGRTAADALFLARFDRSMLAFMYVTAAISTAVPGLAFSLHAHRFKRGVLILATLGISAASFGAFAAWGTQGARWPLIALYNFASLFAVLASLQFMTLAGDCFPPREAKRAFPVMGAAAVFGAIILGLATSFLLKAHLLTTRGMLVLVACLIAGSAVGVKLIVDVAAGHQVKVKRQKASARVLGNPHVRVTAATAVLAAFLVAVVDYQFKAFAAAHFTVNGQLKVDEMSAFYGIFFGVTYIGAVLLQVLLSGRLLQRFGAIPAMALAPVAIFGGSAGLLAGVGSQFGMGVGLKGGEGLLRYGLYGSASETLYLVLPSTARAQAKGLVDGVFRPGAEATAGLLISVLVSRLHLPPQRLALVSMVGCAFWFGLLVVSRKRYLDELLAGLRKSRARAPSAGAIDADVTTRAIATLREGLHSSDPDQLRLMLDLVSAKSAPQLVGELCRLLDRQEPDLRARAIQLLRGQHSHELNLKLRAALKDPVEEVRAAAVLAVRDLPSVDLIEVVSPFLESTSPRVQASAAAVLLNQSDAVWRDRALKLIRSLEASDETRDRKAAAEALGALSDPQHQKLLFGLLNDSAISVRKAAIGAAAVMKSPESIPLLIYLLGQHELSRHAADALVEFGQSAVGELGRLLNDPRENLLVRRTIPRILARISAKDALAPLMRAFSSEDRRIRRDAALAAVQVCVWNGIRASEQAVRQSLEAELRTHARFTAVLADFGGLVTTAGEDILRLTLEEALEQIRDNILCFAALIYPSAAIYSVRASIRADDPMLRGNAFEALETLLSPQDRKAMVPLFEESAAPAKKPEPGQKVPGRATVEPWLKEFLAAEDPWLVTVALHVVAELGASSLLEQVKPLVRHPYAPAREAAAKALACLTSPDEFRPLCEHLRDDASSQVRAFSRWLYGLSTGSGSGVGLLARAPAAGRREVRSQTVSAEGQGSFERLAASVRLAALLRLDGDRLVVERASARAAPLKVPEEPMSLSVPSIFQRAVRANTLLLDEVDELTEAEHAFLRGFALAPPAMRAVVPLEREGTLTGLLYLDEEGAISNDHLELALAHQGELAGVLAAPARGEDER